MFGSLPFETVWKQQHNTAQAPPFVFGADDKLIDNHLGRIAKIAVLRLPRDETVRPVETVSVFETQHACLRERAVADFHLSLPLVEVLQRRESMTVEMIMQNGVPLTECAASRILPGQTHAMSLDRQARQ